MNHSARSLSRREDPVLAAYRSTLKPGESLLGSMSKMIAEAYRLPKPRKVKA